MNPSHLSVMHMTYPWIWSRTGVTPFEILEFIYILLKPRQNALIGQFALLSSMWTTAKYYLIFKLGQIFFNNLLLMKIVTNLQLIPFSKTFENHWAKTLRCFNTVECMLISWHFWGEVKKEIRRVAMLCSTSPLFCHWTDQKN